MKFSNVKNWNFFYSLLKVFLEKVFLTVLFLLLRETLLQGRTVYFEQLMLVSNEDGIPSSKERGNFSSIPYIKKTSWTWFHVRWGGVYRIYDGTKKM